MHDDKIQSIVNDYRKQRKSQLINSCEYLNFVFLCGGERYHNDNRTLVQKMLSKREDIRFLYSEELYEIAEFSDLLTFEELLANFSSDIVIIVESYGSVCELGAFSYFSGTLKKLVIINDKAHKGKKTFINDGPIKKVEQISKDRVFHCEFVKDKIDPTKKILILDLALKLGLDLVIKKKRTFHKNDLLLNQDLKTLEIGSLYVLQLLVLEVLRAFICVHRMSIIKYLFDIYEIDEFLVKIEPNINFTSKKNKMGNDMLSIINLILGFLEKIEVIRIEDDWITLLNNNNLDSPINIANLDSVLLKSSYLKSKNFLKNRSRIINQHKKEGREIWGG